MFKKLSSAALSLVLGASMGWAGPFGEGWTLERNASSLAFTSTTENADPATAYFTQLDGTLDADGLTEITINLDSVDTGDALQETRMRFLVFETFRLPEAKVSAQIDPDLLAGLNSGGQKSIVVPITLELNAVSKNFDVELDVVQIAQDIVSVSTASPIALSLADFALLPGLAKLESAAGVSILPKSDVTFELLFQAVPTPTVENAPDTAALQACARQIQTIAASDQVYFTSGSNELETKSYPLLDAIADTMRTCPDLVLRIEGHTDDRGAAAYNTGLSISRAAEVVTYLAVKGIKAERLGATGFGEDRPIADNATKKGRWKNRRIEFLTPGF